MLYVYTKPVNKFIIYRITGKKLLTLKIRKYLHIQNEGERRITVEVLFEEILITNEEWSGKQMIEKV